MHISSFHVTQLIYGALCIIIVTICAFAMVDLGRSGDNFDVAVFIDEKASTKIEGIVRLENESWFIRSSSKLNFGYTPKPVWLIIPPEEFSSEQNIVDLNFPQLDFVDLYVVDSESKVVINHQVSGDRRSLNAKTIKSEKVMFDVRRPEKSFYIYIRIQTDGSNQTPITITSFEQYLTKVDSVSSLLHFFLGFSLFASVLYGMSLYVHRDIVYLYYIILNASISLFLLFHYRIINVYTDLFSIYAQHIGIVLAIMVSFYSAIKFVQIHFKRWGFDKFDRQLGYAGSLAMLLMLSFLIVEYQISLILTFVFLGLIAPYIMVMLISFVINNYESKFIRLGRSVAAAWVLFLIGATAQILGEAGVIVDTSYVNHGFLFGSLGIVISMGLILSSNLQLENEQKVQAEKELAEANERLYQSDKLSAISTMSSGLIHEIKNPLNWTKASLVIASEEVDETDELKELLDDSLEGVGRIEKIVNGLNWFAKSRELALKPGVNLHSLIEKTLNLAKSQCEGIAIHNDVSGDIEVLGSETHLAQVIINILSNSIKAIEKIEGVRQGTIHITAAPFCDRKDDGKKRDKPQVFLSWVDNGIGIDESLSD